LISLRDIVSISILAMMPENSGDVWRHIMAFKIIRIINRICNIIKYSLDTCRIMCFPPSLSPIFTIAVKKKMQIRVIAIHTNLLPDLDLIDLLCLTPLSAIFQLYHCDQFEWWKKPERTTDHGQATGKLYHLRLWIECTFFVIYKAGHEPSPYWW
jgi:hypothetical protein